MVYYDSEWHIINQAKQVSDGFKKKMFLSNTAAVKPQVNEL